METEYLCEIAYMVAVSGFTPRDIHNIDTDYDYTIEEALEFYVFIYNSFNNYEYSLLDELYNLKKDDYIELAKRWLKENK